MKSPTACCSDEGCILSELESLKLHSPSGSDTQSDSLGSMSPRSESCEPDEDEEEVHHKAEATNHVEDKAAMREQSPIDISRLEGELTQMKGADVTMHLGRAAAELVHQRSNFKVLWHLERENFLTINGKTFYTVQFHLHTPSEHTVDGEAQAMELHLVHQADDGSLAVVGLFLKLGKENKFLAQFWHRLHEVRDNHGHHIPIGELDGALLGDLNGAMYRYKGSLTTPPFSEGVEWIVLSEIAEMEQIMQMMDDIHKLKKMMDSVFEKIESHSDEKGYDAVDAYADKDRILEMLNRLSQRMADADMSNLTATPTNDATPEEIAVSH
ncbi:hypothetical protein P43SY_009964 [Pythium insidiosum]|uniref:carbonic anhydrase n=1 Tax=Pythium insidiosum TaxID=114742 RepID=A0AAD5Q269_PYTIN|nr:hypothetical protein P43SY_009964 [Pythium insidiosum]